MAQVLTTNPLTGQQQYVDTMDANGPAVQAAPGGAAPQPVSGTGAGTGAITQVNPITGAATGQPAGNPAAATVSAGAQAASKGAQAGAAAAAPIDPVTGQPSTSTDPTMQPGYDPSNPQPYQDQSNLAQVGMVPSAASALPPEQPIDHLGATSPAGAAAYVANQVFRGYMQGRAVADIRRGIQLKKESDGLQSLYHTAAENLYNLAQKGTDPNSQEFKDAQAQATSAWQANVDFLGKHVQQQQDQSGSKKSVKQVAGNLLQRIFKPQDPAEVAPAIYEAMQKTGPPVLHQIAPFLTPQYQAKVQQQAGTRGVAAQTAQTGALTADQQAQMTQQLTTLRAEPNPTDDDINQMTHLQSALRPAAAPIVKPYKLQNGNVQYFDPTRPDMIPEGATAVLGAAQGGLPNSAKVPTRMWSTVGGKPMSVMVDKITNQPDNSTWSDKFQPPANIMGRLSSSSMTDANGVTTTRSSKTGPSYTATTTASPTGPEATAAAQQSNAAAIAASGHTPGQPVQPGVSLQLHPNAGTPAAIKSLPPGVPKSAAPVDPNKDSVAPSAPGGWPPAPDNIKSWAYRMNTGQSKMSEVPASLRTAVANYMRINNIETVTPENAAQNNSEAAMKDMMPAIDKAISQLEPHKGEGGLADKIEQSANYAKYKFGVDPGKSASDLNQALGFIKIAGTAPWTKVGRGVQIMKMIQEHLPNPAVDSPGLSYNKLVELKTLLQGQQNAVATRLNRVPGQPPGQLAKPPNQTDQPATPAPVKQHSLATAMALPFNQGKTAAQVTADLKAHHYLVVP